MNKKVILILFLITGLAVTIYFVLNPVKQKNTLLNPLSQNTTKEILPSETSLEYTDPSGFSFNYPDNLSIKKQEITDNNTYADIELFSKDINGSLSLKITDSKFATLDDWLKSNQLTSNENPKEVKLGSLKAMEVKLKDRLILGALDSGILFNIEMPLIEENFWMKVYNKVLASFSFASPENASSTGASASNVIFEGEEVIE